MFTGEFLNDIPIGGIFIIILTATSKKGKYENGEKQGEWKN